MQYLFVSCCMIECSGITDILPVLVLALFVIAFGLRSRVYIYIHDTALLVFLSRLFHLSLTLRRKCSYLYSILTITHHHVVDRLFLGISKYSRLFHLSLTLRLDRLFLGLALTDHHRHCKAKRKFTGHIVCIATMWCVPQ
jgi:hypothetical protein